MPCARMCAVRYLDLHAKGRLIMSGYQNCACRDCFEIYVGEPGELCHLCEDAGCDAEGESECKGDHSYGGEGA